MSSLVDVAAGERGNDNENLQTGEADKDEVEHRAARKGDREEPCKCAGKYTTNKEKIFTV